VFYGINSDLPGGVVYTGNLIFQNGYDNLGTVDGNADFYTDQASFNFGTTTGDTTFYGYYTGIAHDSADNTLYVDGSVYQGTGIIGGLMYDQNATLISNIEFSNGESNYNTTQADEVVFNDTSHNSNLVIGNTTFNDTSYNPGQVTGDATFNTTAYASTTPTGGVMSFENIDWSGTVSGQVLGSDSNPITTYVFYGNRVNYGTINGNAIFYDSSFNAGTITGNATYMNASNGTHTLTGSQVWAGTVSGTIKGGDDIEITELIFNDSSTNQTTIASNITSTFNNFASNYGTIEGDANFNGVTFRIGTVNGTATLSGLSQTIIGVSNIFNFIKQALTRDVLYMQQGSALGISGLATIFGADANNLLSIRSTSISQNANLRINGTLSANFLRLKNISNPGLSQNVSTQTIFDDGSNSGFTFRANATPSTRSSVTSSYTPPALPPSRIPTPPPTTSNPTPTVSNNTSNRGQSSGTIDRFFVKNIAPLLFDQVKKFDLFKPSKTTNIGNTVIPSPFKNFRVPTVLDFKQLPTNFLNNVNKFILNKENKLELFTVKSNNKSVPVSIKYNKTENTVTQSVSVLTNQNLDIKLNTKEGILNGTFNQKGITFNKGNRSITTPSLPGTYYLKADNSSVTLAIQVTNPVVESKKTGIWSRFKALFR
jgi:hypothetical protein